MYECGWCNMYKTDNFVKQPLHGSFRNKMLLRQENQRRLLEKVKSGSLLGYVQCDIEVPEKLPEAFANFPPIFKNINVGGDDIGPLKKEFTEKK